MIIVRDENNTIEKTVPKIKQGRQKLTDNKIIDLVGICAKIKNHYRKPHDIEWVFENNKFYIVQSRPITTL